MNVSSVAPQPYGSSGSNGLGAVGGRRHHHRGQDMQTIADTLGISTDQLKQELGSGNTLAQVAQNHGKTADDLVNALQAKDKSRLDQAVSNGKVSSDQETQILSQLKQRETGFVNSAPHQRGQGGPPPGPLSGGEQATRALDDVASMLGASGLQSIAGGRSSAVGQALCAYGADANSTSSTTPSGGQAQGSSSLDGSSLSVLLQMTMRVNLAA